MAHIIQKGQSNQTVDKRLSKSSPRLYGTVLTYWAAPYTILRLPTPPSPPRRSGEQPATAHRQARKWKQSTRTCCPFSDVLPPPLRPRQRRAYGRFVVCPIFGRVAACDSIRLLCYCANMVGSAPDVVGHTDFELATRSKWY
jgi:hypothetical protein